jgi:hypothetical protein
MIQKQENRCLRSFIVVSVLVLMAIPGSTAESNLVSIDDVVLDAGKNITIPIMIDDATGVAAVGLNLRYDPDVVNVTNAEQGDFTDHFRFNNSNAANGWATINTYKQKPESEPITWPGLIGDVKVADVTLEAVGNPGDSSPLNLEIISLAEPRYANELPRTTRNGTFIISGTAPEPVDPAPVPAFTTFGMLVVTGLLCAIGVTAVRKKRKI